MVDRVQIHPYREADSEGVAALWSTAFPDPAPRNVPGHGIAATLALQRELFFVAVDGGSVYERLGFSVEERISMGKALFVAMG